MEQPTTTTTITTSTGRTFRRALAVAVAGAVFGLAGAGAIAARDEPAAVQACRPNEADLLLAAAWARQLEAERPELFEDGLRSRYDDLRLAAEWARRLEVLRPELVC